MDQELKAYLEGWFTQLEKKVQEDLRVIARGVMSVSERLEEFQVDATTHLEEIRKWVAPDDEIPFSRPPKDLNEEIRRLDRRIKRLEARADRRTTDSIEALCAMNGPREPQTP